MNDDNVEDNVIDLRALDVFGSAERREQAIAQILSAAAPQLARRAEARSPVIVLARWSAPALAFVTVMAALSLATLWRVDRRSPEVPVATVSEALLPTPVSTWVSEDRPPSNSDLILAVEGESQ
jgi:hypothetical protein